MLKAKCIRQCDTYHGIKGASTKSCCGSSFEAGKLYDFDMVSDTNINSRGEIEIYFSTDIYDGSQDGYDVDCGINFQTPEFVNYYFKFVEQEEIGE